MARLASGANDTLSLWDASNSSSLPVGSINLGRNDYVNGSRTFGLNGTASSLTLSGSQLVVVLGTASGVTPTAGGTGTMSWSPGAGLTDRAGNPLGLGAVTETGLADTEF